jgi:hypothetical protein
MGRLLTLALGLVLMLSTTSIATAETFNNPQGNFNWKVYDYNASGQALRVRQPFLVNNGTDGGIAFNFLYTPDTALFMTGHPSYRGDLLGDMSNKTIEARVRITITSGDPQFTYYGEGTPNNPCPYPANVRFFFQTRTNGPFNPSDYWWSNPENATLESLKTADQTITASVEPGMWTNYYGQPDPAGFAIAEQNVAAIGLSFGGGCFFENGVGIRPNTGSAYFRLMDYSATPLGAVDPLATAVRLMDYSATPLGAVDPLATVVPELILAPFVVPTLIDLNAELAPISAAPALGTAANFAVLAGTAATCTNSSITGDVGSSAPASVVQTGCTITGTIHAGDAVAPGANDDFLSTYSALAAKTCDQVLTGTLAGVTLAPGVYCFDAAATSTGGALTLSGPSNGTWIFKIGTSGTGALTGTNFSVVMADGAQPSNVYWWVAQAATMTDSHFVGTMLSGAAITITGGTFAGNAFAKAAVTMTGTTLVVR